MSKEGFDADWAPEGYGGAVLSPERLAELKRFPFDADVVLHECGVPPIHTPLEALLSLPEESKKGLYLIHIGGAAADKAKAAGLKLVVPGVKGTIRVEVPPSDRKPPTITPITSRTSCAR